MAMNVQTPKVRQEAGGGKRVLIIGGGPAGYVAAIRAAQLGAEVTVIEKRQLGGACLNVGCIPTKCLLHSAGLIGELRKNGAALGVRISDMEIDFARIMERKNELCQRLTGGIDGLFRANRIRRIAGEASFPAPGALLVREAGGGPQRVMTADAVLIAVGSVNAQPPIPGLRQNPSCIDSTGALSLDTLPKSMVVIGGGVIGLELACAYAALGTRITVIEAMARMLPMLDGELAAFGLAHMQRMGISFELECSVQAVKDAPAGARVVCRRKGGELVGFEAEKVLVATGRRANTAPLNLEAGGVAHERGRILVNQRMETNVPGIYAAGDCVLGHAQLAHTASAMGEVAAENMMGLHSVYDERTNPTCVYIEPEAASVGLTEEQAGARGLRYQVGRFSMAANGRALILNGGEGLVKIIAGERDGEVLGVHIIGPHAADLIAEGALAIRLEATVDELISTIHSHPTVTEAIREAALNVKKRAIHIKN